MKNKNIKILSVLLIQLMIIVSCTSVFASTMIDYNGNLHKLVLKSDKSKDFSQESQVVGNDNGKGTIKLENIDAEHGASVVLSTSNSYTGEGPWVQFDGDNSLSLLMYEFELYVKELSGEIKFQVRANGTFECLNINEDGIGVGEQRTALALGQWNKLRIMFDRTGTKMYLYVNNDEPVEFTGGSLWRLGKGIEYMRIALSNTTDAYVAADNFNIYEVKEMPAGYETPRLTLKPQEDKITESKSARIEAVIETKAEIEKVDFYINDELIYTDDEAPYILDHMYEPGTYTVRAEATDVYGEKGESEIEIKSMADTRPRISIDLTDGGEYDRNVLTEVLVAVTMSEAQLAEGKIAVDGEKIASLEMGDNTVDISGLSVGRHIISAYAKNHLGEEVEKSVQITVVKTLDDVVWSADFNDGTLLGQLNASGQFTRLEVLRQDFKESLLAGANTEQDVSKEGAWIPVSLKNTSTTAVVDFDIYFSNINGNGLKTRLNYLQSYRPEMFLITTRGISAGSETHPFEAKRWYHITLEVNSQTATYSLALDGEQIFKDVAITNMPKGVAMDSIRVISMLQGGEEETYYAIDNIVVRQITAIPSIVNITSMNGDENVVSVKDREITVYFSGGLEPSSVYASKFTINGAEIEKAVYDDKSCCVTLTLKEPLLAGTYRLTTAENLVMGNGDIYAEKLYGDFEVRSSVFETVASEVKENRITASIKNNSSENKTVYMIVNLYNGTTMKSSSAEEITLVSGENTVSRLINGYASGDKAEVFIWDSLLIPNCIMNASN